MADVSVDSPMEKPAEKEGGAKGVRRDSAGRRIKGRGNAGAEDSQMQQREGHFESIGTAGAGAAKSIEGWILFITGLDQETQEDDIHDKFCDFGDIKNLHLNLDRRTGFVKGYALVEFEQQPEAQAAIDALNGTQVLGSTISVDWAFSRGPARRAAPAGGQRCALVAQLLRSACLAAAQLLARVAHLPWYLWRSLSRARREQDRGGRRDDDDDRRRRY